MSSIETSKTGSNYIRLCDDQNIVDFVSIPIKRLEWNTDNSNLAGLYINQAMYNQSGFTKRFVGEIDIIDNSGTRVTSRLSKQNVQNLIQALIELNKNL